MGGGHGGEKCWRSLGMRGLVRGLDFDFDVDGDLKRERVERIVDCGERGRSRW